MNSRLFLLIFLAGVLPGSLFGQTTLVDSSGRATISGPAFLAVGEMTAQAFVTGPAPKSLDTITVLLEKVGFSSITVRARILSDFDSGPAQQVDFLGDQTLDDPSESETATFTSQEKLLLLPNTRYWVVITNLSGSFGVKRVAPFSQTTVGELESLNRNSDDDGENWENRNIDGIFQMSATCDELAQATVTSKLDDSSGGTLREVIATADADERPFYLTFDPALEGETIFLTSGNDLYIGDDIIIDASDLEGGITISGDADMSGDASAGDTRVMEISSEVALLDSVTITRGVGKDGTNGVSSSLATGERGGGIDNRAALTLRNCRVIGNRAGNGATDSDNKGGRGGLGGGIYSQGPLALNNCLVSANRAGDSAFGNPVGSTGGEGGGIYTSSFCVIRNSTVAANTAGDGGDGSNIGGFGGNGGGVLSSSGMLIESSTISGNRCGVGGDGPSRNGDGGSGGGLFTLASCVIRNSTISGNESGYGNYNITTGGGIRSRGALTLENVTITENRAGDSAQYGGWGGGLYHYSIDPEDSLTISNSIIAGNFFGVGENSPFRDGKGPDVYLQVNSGPHPTTLLGVNLIGDNSDVDTIFPTGFPNGNGDMVGESAAAVDPLLGPLEDNGGATFTHLPMEDSPVIDPIGGDTATELAADQRGLSRLGKSAVDIGAVEIQGPSVSLQKGNLKKKIRKLTKKLKLAKRNKQLSRVKRFQKQINKLKRRLRGL